VRVGVPREVKNRELRVALTPSGAHELVGRGHEVLVEAGAGVGSSIPDDAYAAAGARVVATAEVFSSALLDARRSPEGTEPVPHQLIVRKDLLDDSNAAKGPVRHR